MRPNVAADSRALPFGPNTFDLINWDPHPWTPFDMIRDTAGEAARVALPGAVLAFKWGVGDLKDVLLWLDPWWEPLFGHAVERDVSWVLLRKKPALFVKFAWA